MSEVQVKIQRILYPPGRPAMVTSRFGQVNKTMHLPDEVRWQMGGERVAYFLAEDDGKTVTIKTRIPDESW